MRYQLGSCCTYGIEMRCDEMRCDDFFGQISYEADIHICGQTNR